MDTARIAELLLPFTGADRLPASLLERLQLYMDLLLRWNARINLTSVRSPEYIVTRHFGESLFAAKILLDSESSNSGGARALRHNQALETIPQNFSPPILVPVLSPSPLEIQTLADVGSGAGFPGILIKLFAPGLALTLIESHSKKATFLREVVRALDIDGVDVFTGRAEDWGKKADLVTFRAVEKFGRILPVAANLVAENGRLGLLIGQGQLQLLKSCCLTVGSGARRCCCRRATAA